MNKIRIVNKNEEIHFGEIIKLSYKDKLICDICNESKDIIIYYKLNIFETIKIESICEDCIPTDFNAPNIVVYNG